MRYLIGNWKSYHTINEAKNWLREFADLTLPIPRDLSLILCPAFVCLSEVLSLNNQLKLPFVLGAQDVSSFPKGKHTGQVNAEMLSELVRFCIVGHSERRIEEGESSEIVTQKVSQLLNFGITPIICLDTPYLADQIESLKKANLSLERCFFAYEPSAAIGSGHSENPQIAEEVATEITRLTQSNSPVIYGGSITAENVTAFLNCPHLQGTLVGTDSLEVQSFVNLIKSLS